MGAEEVYAIQKVSVQRLFRTFTPGFYVRPDAESPPERKKPMASTAFDSVATALRAATTYTEVFGLLHGDAISRKAQLRKQFAYLANIVHPDHVEDTLKAAAQQAFETLVLLRSGAEDAIARGMYEQPFHTIAAATYTVALTSTRGTYKLADAAFCEGDFSALYKGEGKTGAITAKIALEPACTVWLEREASFLAEFMTNRAVQSLQPYVPNLIDTFLVKEGSKQFRVNIIRAVPDLVSIQDIITAFPGGLESPQAAWVARRIIAQVIAATMLGAVHGAITPDHVLVDPYKHEPLHIGWAHAIRDPKGSHVRITQIVERHRDLYPPEVFTKTIPDERTDIYMAGATIVKLLGGDVKARTLPVSVPDEMSACVMRAIEPTPGRRFSSGVQFLDEFTRVVRGIWGRVYRPLIMPVR